MAVETKYISFSTKGNTDIIDLTPKIASEIETLNIKSGIVNISACGSTAGITTCEFEPGLVKDIQEFFNQMIPRGDYHHNLTWGDDNGHSHLRSTLVGTTLTVPFADQKLILGPWQQIIFIDFDSRARQRKIACQFIGE